MVLSAMSGITSSYQELGPYFRIGKSSAQSNRHRSSFRKKDKWAHEDGSQMMIDYTVKANNINIPQDEVDFIKDLVRGEVHHTKSRFVRAFIGLLFPT